MEITNGSLNVCKIKNILCSNTLKLVTSPEGTLIMFYQCHSSDRGLFSLLFLGLLSTKHTTFPPSVMYAYSTCIHE